MKKTILFLPKTLLKSLFLMLFLAFFVYQTKADCLGSGFMSFVVQNDSKQMPIIVFQGYAGSQPVIFELNKKYPIYLKNGKKQIKLIVKEINIGQFMLTQAILMPEEKLVIGKEYVVIIDNLPEEQKLNRFDQKIPANQVIKFVAGAGKDMNKDTKTLFASNPKEVSKDFIMFGCGPAMHVTFDLTNKNATTVTTVTTELLVKTTVKNLKTGKESTYYLPTSNNQVSIGHGMCEGAFTFDVASGYEYEVKFAITDFSKNTQIWESEKVKFTSPTEKNSRN